METVSRKETVLGISLKGDVCGNVEEETADSQSSAE